MNTSHRQARMTPLDRAEMIRRIIGKGRPAADAAVGFDISARTARTWRARWRTADIAGLAKRSPRLPSTVDGAAAFRRASGARLRRACR
ncbi:helix-turn-helix domain-containing protein [Chelatococcus daeguensis]|uniref:helix-turn-helix domain-containing protein n=1 Tax=Chelatococcus daeguensis TaxID=444444 RepID=UPI0007AB5737|nr:leucine zipper domain-containing protein [Chelatococcus daeguensis]KZE27946.1 hypothetical protein AVW15_07395 [Chelatococcus daeguensis]MBM3084510.1 helix-turn-helix domain-containing protein [Chelatococcus daeguensis]